MSGKYLEHIWRAGYLLGAGLALALWIVLPEPFGFKIWILLGTLAAGFIGSLVTYRARYRGMSRPKPSARASMQFAEARFPARSELLERGDAVGVFRAGVFRNNHFLLRVGEDGRYWCVVQSRGQLGRLRPFGEGLSRAAMKERLLSADARFLPPGIYSEAVARKWFGLMNE